MTERLFVDQESSQFKSSIFSELSLPRNLSFLTVGFLSKAESFQLSSLFFVFESFISRCRIVSPMIIFYVSIRKETLLEAFEL
jgi:hypothetical protein